MPLELDGPGPWELPIGGFEVLHMTFGAYLVDIFAYVFGGATVQLRFAGPFTFLDPPDVENELDPQTDAWAALGVLFALRHDVIKSATATADSRLDVVFESGRELRSGPHEKYENWEIHGPGFMLIGAATETRIWEKDRPGSTVTIRGDPRKNK
jgi:hypothetical protein